MTILLLVYIAVFVRLLDMVQGLICPSSGQLVPLKAFHIRAQLVDVTAEVNQSIFSLLKTQNLSF